MSTVVKKAVDLGYSRPSVLAKLKEFRGIVDIEEAAAIDLLIGADFDVAVAVSRYFDAAAAPSQPSAGVHVKIESKGKVVKPETSEGSSRGAGASQSQPVRKGSGSAAVAAAAAAAASAPAVATGGVAGEAGVAAPAAVVAAAPPPAVTVRPPRPPSSDRIEIKVVRDGKETTFGLKSSLKFGKLMVRMLLRLHFSLLDLFLICAWCCQDRYCADAGLAASETVFEFLGKELSPTDCPNDVRTVCLHGFACSHYPYRSITC